MNENLSVVSTIIYNVYKVLKLDDSHAAPQRIVRSACVNYQLAECRDRYYAFLVRERLRAKTTCFEFAILPYKPGSLNTQSIFICNVYKVLK
jgi:hypothetical protein